MVDDYNGEGFEFSVQRVFVLVLCLCLEGEKKRNTQWLLINKVTFEFLSLKSLTHHMPSEYNTCATSSLNRFF